MQTFLLVVHLLIVVTLVIVVLLQRSEGGALGIGGGGFMTGRGQANVLTRATAILAGLFFLTSLALTVHANLVRAPKSILEDVTTQPKPQVPNPTTAPSGTVLDELQKLEEQRQSQTPTPTPTPTQPQTPQSQ
jgi:preprotein translocase subunit SecG